jgi:hypothetical protein
VREDTNRTQETTKQLKKRMMGDLDMVVLKAMHREPRLRYGSAQELAEDLDRFMNGQAVLARPRQGLNAKAIGIAAALLVVLGGGAAFFLNSEKPEKTVETPQPTTDRGYTPPVVETSPPKSEPLKQDPVVAPIEKPAITKPAPTGTTPPVVSQPIPSTPAPAPVPPAAVVEGLDEARDKYANVAGKVAAAEEMFQKVKADLAAKGLSMRADTASRVLSMKMNLEQAKQDLDRTNVAGAMKNLTAAEAQAARVSKEFGR